MDSKQLSSFKTDTPELPSSVDQLTYNTEQSMPKQGGAKPKEIAGKTGNEDSLGR